MMLYNTYITYHVSQEEFKIDTISVDILFISFQIKSMISYYYERKQKMVFAQRNGVANATPQREKNGRRQNTRKTEGAETTV